MPFDRPQIQPVSDEVAAFLWCGQTWSFRAALDAAEIRGAYYEASTEGENPAAGRQYYRTIQVDLSGENGQKKIKDIISEIFHNLAAGSPQIYTTIWSTATASRKVLRPFGRICEGGVYGLPCFVTKAENAPAFARADLPRDLAIPPQCPEKRWCRFAGSRGNARERTPCSTVAELVAELRQLDCLSFDVA